MTNGRVQIFLLLLLLLQLSTVVAARQADADTAFINSLIDKYWLLRKSSQVNALNQAHEVIAVSEKANYKVGIAQGKQLAGITLRQMGRHEEALRAQFVALRLFTELQDVNEQVYCLNNIGVIFKDLEQYAQALKYYEEALELRNKLESEKPITITLHAVGELYRLIGNSIQAEAYIKEALELNTKINDEKGKAVNYGTLSNIYYDLNEADRAYIFANKAYQYNLENADSIGLIYSSKQLAQVYLLQNKLDESLKMAMQAERLNEALGREVLKLDIKELLVDIYSARGELAEAIELQRDLSNMKLRQQDQRLQRQLLNLDMNYRLERREQQINLLEESRSEQQKLVFVLLSSLVMVLVLAGVAMSLYRKARRVNRSLAEKNKLVEDLNESLHQQTEEIATQRDDLAEKTKLLEETNSSKNRFFSIISHDVKGPLNSIKAITSMLDKHIEALSKEDISRFGRELNDTTIHLYKLLENLLLWSQAEAGAMVLEKKLLSLNQLAHDVVGVLAPTARQKGIDLENTIAEGLHAIGDENTVATVLRNLVNNAIKFTPRQGSVTVGAELNEQKEAVLFVTDTGLGMNQQQMDNLFQLEKKSSTKGTEDEKGTGMGLLISQDFVQMNNGKIWVESKEGKGSTFYFTLPNAQFTDSPQLEDQELL